MSLSKNCITIYKRLNNSHLLCMSVSKMCITLLWRSSKCAPPFMSVSTICIASYEGHNQLHLLLHERFKNVRHGFMKASTTRISFFWGCQKFASRFMKVWAIRIPFTWASQECASRFYEGLKNVHLLCMSLSAICITICDGLLKTESPFVWALQQCASRFYEGLKHVHLLCMSLWKMCITIYEGRKN